MSLIETEIRKTAAVHFHISEFRPLQKEVILSILEKKHTLAVLPTGSGKSITYQIPALIMEGLALVVTPLISLMKDQIRVLKERGIGNCEYLSSDRPENEKQAVLDKLHEWKILYVTPERLESMRFSDQLKRSGIRLTLIVIDEAHCVSLWGNTFRPSYRKIKDFIKLFPGVTVAAFTGTASAELREDIRAGLGMEGWNVIASSVARDNISISVRFVTDKTRFILERMKEERNTIIYTTSKYACNRLHYQLCHLGFPAAVYHADLSREDRDTNQKIFISGEKKIMVATSAFGMGIDKPDIRDIVHFNIVPEAEEYFQEIGRAGRDGKEARAVTLVEPEDIGEMELNLAASYPDWVSVRRMLQNRDLLPSERTRMEEIAEMLSLGSFRDIVAKKKEYLEKRDIVMKKAMAMKRFIAGPECRKVSLMRLFGETSLPCGKCDHCVALREHFHKGSWTEKDIRLIAVMGGFRKGISLDELRSRALGLKKRDIWKSGFGTLRGTDMLSFGGIVCDLKNYHVLCLDPEAHSSVVLNPLFNEWVRSVSPFSFF